MDKDGNLQPNANNIIHFSIEGSAIIQALGNANLKSEDCYVGNECKVYQGNALVVIKGNRLLSASDVTLIATAKELEKAKMNLKIK